MRLGTALKVLATVAGRSISAGVEEKKGLLQFWFWMFVLNFGEYCERCRSE